MAITLKADNRNLTVDAKYSYLTDNQLSAVSSFAVTNSAPFAADDFVLVGEIGNETSEIRRVQSVASATHTLTLTAATSFAHPESTRITKIPYDKVRFYWTATAVFDSSTPVTGYVDIQVDDYYSVTSDTIHSTGFGWFLFYNSVTSVATSYSNPIPYANFSRFSVKRVLDGFLTLLNNNDRKLIGVDDMMEWLNEGYLRARADLNMPIKELYASDGTTALSVVAGTSEYALAADFGGILKVWDADNGVGLEPIDVQDIEDWNELSTGTPARYYVRGSYIGFVPQPDSGYGVTYRYTKLPSELTSYYDVIDLPNALGYAMKDFLMWRAKQKLRHADANTYLESFERSVATAKTQAINRDNSRDSWAIVDSANV